MNSYGSLSSHFIFLKWVMSIASPLIKLAGAIQVSKTLYSVTAQSKQLSPLNLGKTLALLKLLSFCTNTTGKRTHTFVLLIKHSEKLSVLGLLYDKDLIIYHLHIFIYKHANIMHCVQIYL